ncbi:MAG: bifunctional precorrin-2 dehydrogenase/sirohydrochlorin ferrochelatase, partial [Reichenbachiella sp.]
MRNSPGNNLMPVFLKLEEMKVLIVGGMYVGWEKLSAVLANSPNTEIRLVASEIGKDIRDLAAENKNVTLLEKPFQSSDLNEMQLVIIGINDIEKSAEIRNLAHQQRLLVNVADKPDLCDFYLSSVVKKGDLKIAISTNGKSPTVAKRMKEFLNETIPDTIDDILQNMTKIRNKLKGDFEYKV